MGKKNILLILMFSSASFMFSQEYYASNKSGMTLSRIPGYRIDEYEYFIEKSVNGKIETKILYHNSAPVAETVTWYSEDGEIIKETIKEENSITEKLFENSLLLQEKVTEGNQDKGYLNRYRYNASRQLDHVETYDLSENLSSSVTYRRDAKGRIISVNRVDYSQNSEGNDISGKHVSRYRFAGRSLLEEWHGNDYSTGTFIFYDSDGKISSVIEKVDGKTASEKKYRFNNDGTHIITEDIPSEGKKIISFAGTDGFINEEQTFVNGTLVSKNIDTYENKNLTKRITITPQGTYRYLYEYENDKLSSETWFFNGEIVKERVYTDDNNYYEDLYSGSRKYIRVYYENNEKTRAVQW